VVQDPCREDVQQKGQISRERLSDVVYGIAGIGSEGDDNAESYRCKSHRLRALINVEKGETLWTPTMVALVSVFAHADDKCENMTTLHTSCEVRNDPRANTRKGGGGGRTGWPITATKP
jgi:hypothetical protein